MLCFHQLLHYLLYRTILLRDFFTQLRLDFIHFLLHHVRLIFQSCNLVIKSILLSITLKFVLLQLCNFFFIRNIVNIQFFSISRQLFKVFCPVMLASEGLDLSFKFWNKLVIFASFFGLRNDDFLELWFEPISVLSKG